MTADSMVTVAADRVFHAMTQSGMSGEDATVCAQVVISNALYQQVDRQALGEALADVLAKLPSGRFGVPFDCRFASDVVVASVLRENVPGFSRWSPQARFAPTCGSCGAGMVRHGLTGMTCDRLSCMNPTTVTPQAYVRPAVMERADKWEVWEQLFADKAGEYDGHGPNLRQVCVELSCRRSLAHAVIVGNIDLDLLNAVGKQALSVMAPFPAELWSDLGFVGRAPWLRRTLLMLDNAGVQCRFDPAADVYRGPEEDNDE